MAHHYVAATVDDLMRFAVEAIRADGAPTLPTQGACSEITAATFELTNPRARVSRSAARGRLFSALGELCWYLSGSNKTADIAYYASAYQDSDEDGFVYGGYGPRLVTFDGINQIEFVIQALREEPHSRRTVVQLFDHRDVYGSVRHKDVPCTCTLQYLLRDGRLTAITYMRSNDVFLGLPHDVFCFTMLQELFARAVGAELGSYHHLVGSLHMYDRNSDVLKAFLAEGWQATTLSMPPMPQGDPWGDVQDLLVIEERLRSGTPPGEINFSGKPYWADLERLLGAYAVRDDAREILDSLRRSLSDDYYDTYVADRIDRLDHLREA